MKKCIVVSDSFKGTLSSQEICTLAAQRLEAYFPGCEVVRIPVADGGEGTVACFHEACGGTLVSVPVSGPYGEAITAEYLQLPGGQAVRCTRFLDRENLAAYRARLRFNERAAAELLEQACALMAQAKSCHDELETYYRAAVDFAKVDEAAKECAGLFGLE